MAKTIEVYITNREVITQTGLEGRPLAAGDGVHYCSVKEISKTERIVPDEDKAALQLVKTLVAKKGFKIQVIDIANLKGKIRARLKGVKTTPTIIVGNNRLVGVPEKEDFEALLEQ